MIVEYDGSYYHAGKVRADREQTAALESAGWTVFRVREQPLPQLGGYEISVSPTQSIKSVAIEVIRGLAPIDYEASRMSEYIAARAVSPWRRRGNGGSVTAPGHGAAPPAPTTSPHWWRPR